MATSPSTTSCTPPPPVPPSACPFAEHRFPRVRRSAHLHTHVCTLHLNVHAPPICAVRAERATQLRHSACGRYHNRHLYFIDVSQSVEHDHPHAMDFLRKDCENIASFYTKKVCVCV